MSLSEVRHRLPARALAQLAQQLDILLVYIYGSQARDKARADSDYDFAVLPNDHRVWTGQAEWQCLDRFADGVASLLAVSRDRIDVQSLAKMPVTIAVNLAEHGRCLYEGEPKLDVYFRRQAVSRYLDFEPIESFFRQQLHRRIAEGRFGC